MMLLLIQIIVIREVKKLIYVYIVWYYIYIYILYGIDFEFNFDSVIQLKVYNLIFNVILIFFFIIFEY